MYQRGIVTSARLTRQPPFIAAKARSYTRRLYGGDL